ncbi:MAG TPA: HEXXH motif-containing putative peptide modification protein [Candidatus Polarisedimenticolaceae bacterium]
MRYLDRLVPPDPHVDAPLRRAIARDAASRLRRIAGKVSDVPPEILASGDFRTWLASVEDALDLERATIGPKSALVEKVADAGWLARLAPTGRIPRNFPDRVRKAVREELKRASRSLRRILGIDAVHLDDDADRGRRLGDPVEHAPIVVGRLLESKGLEVRIGRPVATFETRVASALELLARAWPEGRNLLAGRVWCVVPVAEWATVSYSSPRKPGIVYIHVDSSPLVRVAEDLVHETSHVRLHEIEAVHPLLAAKALAEDGPRFYSPWRREWRPLRGLLHACTTFTVGARFFERMLASDEAFPAARRLWLARRLLEEQAMVASSLPVLRAAGRAKWFTAAGRRVASAIEREHRALRGAAARAARTLEATPAGRAQLARYERLRGRLAARPVRWNWD